MVVDPDGVWYVESKARCTDMFDNSRKIRTAIEAVVYIALNGTDGPVHSRELTRQQDIAPRYLEPVLQRLGRAGIVDGIRGPRGGYVLARERRRIPIGEIVRTVMAPEDGDVGKGAAPVGMTGPIGRDVVDPLWFAQEEAFLAALDAVTVEDLCRRAIDLGIASRSPQPLDFAI